MDTQTFMIAGLATFSIATIGIFLVEPLLNGQLRAEKRQETIIKNSSSEKTTKPEASNRKKNVGDVLRQIENQPEAKPSLETRLMRAGLQWTRKTYSMFSVAAAIGCAFVLYVVMGYLAAALVGLVIGGFGLPIFYINLKTKKRQAAFLLEFPNAIDVVVRGIRSGLPLNDCFRLIANDSKEPVKSEFRLIMESQQLGLTIADAVQKLFERMPIQEVNFFAIVIQIQSKSGGNLGEILNNLSKVIRERKKFRDKVDAVTNGAKVAALIIGLVPFIVALAVYMLNPSYMSLLWKTNIGMVASGGAMVIITIGWIVMRQMINFEI